MVWIVVDVDGTTGTTPDRLTFTLPVASVSEPNYILNCSWPSGIIGGSGGIGYCFTQGATGFIYAYDLATLGNGTGTVRVNGFYEAA
jgi:hypothetical protein